MKQYTLNGYTIAFPEIPEGATGIGLSKPSITTGDKIFFWWEKEQNLSFDGFCFKTLPPGDWQLFRLSEVPESLAGEMAWFCPGYGYKNYKCGDYNGGSSPFDVWVAYHLKTAHASFVSWVRAQGVTEENPYLLIKKND